MEANRIALRYVADPADERANYEGDVALQEHEEAVAGWEPGILW